MAILGQAGRVGAVVLLGLALVAGMFAFFSGGLFRHTYTLGVLFNDATGATKDAAVALAGVPIGKVRDIRLTGAQQADLTLEIQDKYRIPRGSTFSITTPILGTAGTVVVTPPPDAAKRPDDMIPPDTTGLTGAPALSVNAAFSQASGLMTQLKETVRRSDRLIDTLTHTAQSADNAIAGPAAQKALGNLGEASTNLNRASANGLKLTERLNGVLAQDNAQLQGLLRQTQSGARVALGNIDATTAQIKGLTAENRAKLSEIVTDLQQTTASVSGITDQLNTSFHEGKVPQNLTAIVGNLRAASDNLVVISNNFQKLSGDQGLQGDLRATLRNVRASTEQTTYLLERLNQLAGTKPHPTVVIAPGTTPPGGAPPTRTNQELVAPLLLPRVDLVQDLRASRFRADVDAVVPIRGSAPGAFARAGIYGLGDANRAIAQFGAALDPAGLYDVRAGLYASKLSVGGDIGLGRRATLSLDLWDPNRYHLDARGALMFGGGYGLLVGAEDIARRTSPTIGLEYRR
ncbi:MAG: MCE family protein [Armatimonadetes bacterium]|nr:MCE family protein [Armatimonadota bacterium]